MRYRSRSRNYDSGERYKGHRSPEKYESSRRHKSKEVNTNYSSENRKIESSKYKKTSDRSRYDYHHNSESEDKPTRKGEPSYDRDYKTSKISKYEREESTHDKKSHKPTGYPHTYKRRSVSSDISNDSTKYKRNEDKSDKKKPYYKDSKRSKISRSVSSGDVKLKQEAKEKKEKKIKKKIKKAEKEKIDKKKKKKQKHSLDDEKNLDSKKDSEVKGSGNVVKNEQHEDGESSGKGKVKVEPFKVKESSVIKSQISVLNSSNIFTKDEWQKEASGDEIVKKKESSKGKYLTKEIIDETKGEIKQIKEEKVVKKIKVTEDVLEETNKKRRNKDSKQKVSEKITKNSKEKDIENSETKSKSNRRERSHSHTKVVAEKAKVDYKEKKTRTVNSKVNSKFNDDRKKSDEYLSEDERLELPRTPTDAQFAGLFTRLPEDSVSDTDIEDILPPMLLDDRMNALLDNDPNVAQETWDSDDDVLLNKRENVVAPKHRGVLETLSVPWKILIKEASQTNKIVFKNESLRKYDMPNMLSNIGVSYKLAGVMMLNNIIEKFPNVFLSPIPPIHQNLLSQKVRRNTIFRERSLFAGALSARKDFFIRRVLCGST